MAKLLYRLLNCKVKDLFYKLNVHAGGLGVVIMRAVLKFVCLFVCLYLALEPSQIVDFFLPVFEKATELERAYKRFNDQTKVPFITVRHNPFPPSHLFLPPLRCSWMKSIPPHALVYSKKSLRTAQ